MPRVNKLGRTMMSTVTTMMAHGIKPALEKAFGRNRVGYCIITFEFGSGGGMSVNSDATNESLIQILKELIDRLEGHPPSKVITIH